MTRVAGLVLAGGGGSRLGGVDKALIEVNGRPLITIAIDALHQHGIDRIVIARGDLAPIDGLGPDVEQIGDDGTGPVAALAAGIAAAQTDIVLVVPVDVPEPNVDLLFHLADLLQADEAEVAMPIVDGRHQALHAAWSSRALPRLHAAVEAGTRRLRDVLDQMDVRVVDEWRDADRPAFARDIDVPSDLPDHAATTPTHPDRV